VRSLVQPLYTSALRVLTAGRGLPWRVDERTTLRIDTAGTYLICVESRNTQSDHEHFSAVDLVVGDESKPAPNPKSARP